MKTIIQILLAALLIPGAASAASTTLLNETFDDGNRAGWFSSSSTAIAITGTSAADYKLSITATSTSARPAINYFAPATNPVTLGAGDSISVSLAFTPTSASMTNSGNGFRIGLLNTGSNHQSTDANPSFAATGYAAFLNPTTGAAGPGSIYERNSNENSIISTIGSWDSRTSTSSGTAFALVTNTAYTITFSITLDAITPATGIISYSITDGTNSFGLSFTDTTISATSFDTFAFALHSAVGSATIDNILITTTAPVPEPATTAALLALGAFTILLIRRKSK